MASRSPSRDFDARSRSRTRSPPPRSDYSRSPSPRARRSPNRGSRSPSPRRNGRQRDSRSRSFDRDARIRSRSQSQSPPRSTKIVVERLTKNINEDHLYEIFGQYGPIKDLDLPMNRQFNTNRGTAYILYDNETDAESAIAHMHEAQVDGAIINVSIVLPRRKFSPSPPLARRGGGFDPRGPPPGGRGGRGGFGGLGGPRGRRSPPPERGSGRYGPRSDTYRPRSLSRSPSRSPAPAGQRGRYRSRSASYSSRSRSPPARGRGNRGGHRGFDDYGPRRRSPSRGSYDGHERGSRTRSRSRGQSYR